MSRIKTISKDGRVSHFVGGYTALYLPSPSTTILKEAEVFSIWWYINLLNINQLNIIILDFINHTFQIWATILLHILAPLIYDFAKFPKNSDTVNDHESTMSIHIDMLT